MLDLILREGKDDRHPHDIEGLLDLESHLPSESRVLNAVGMWWSSGGSRKRVCGTIKGYRMKV